ncbi:MAG: glycosyltransferase family 2 protein [Bacteroidales bacterium]|nr:glycosyltransferase [Bacteroidales bacterium]
MNWYTKYLSVFEKPFDSVSQSTIDEIKEKLKHLQSPNPVASVVVIAHNEEQRLLSCIWSLSANITSYPIEIIGVENNSTDRTADVFKAVEIPWYFEAQKSCGYARNRGRMNAVGKYYICIDADTMYPPLYLQTLIEALEKPGVAGVSSLWSFVPDKQFPAWKLKLYDALKNINLRLQSIKRPELSVRGMVFAYNLEYGRKVEYRHNIIRGEDGAMASGLKQYGKIIFIRDRKAMAITCNSALRAEGSIFNALKKRILKAFRHAGGYFVKRNYYKDRTSNLIK